MSRFNLGRLRMHGRRGVVIALAAGLAVVGVGAYASAELASGGSTPDSAASPSSGGNGDDNVAVAVGKDGKSVWAIRLKVVKVSGDVVDAGNAAVAAAGCTDCETVAIAIEGVLVTGDVEVVEPVNIALALNTDCQGCQTLAAAYQTVIGTNGNVRITGEGRRAIADLRKQLHDLRKSGLPLEQIAAEVDRIAAEFTQVLRTQVVPVGPRDKAYGTSTAQPTASPTEEPAPSATATEPASPEPSATPTP
ncbi:MAG: hypothetical protein QOJ92_1459 [Frankiales bacterium]|nr:hypothetical protein [Frankiales bacterium]